ncbi:replication restart DNA helicase PriA [Brevibacterium sanguinis]|uniref:Replication restart DNA helicase PriA n=2 Tax=Brevibacterium TaxID=1696 RepID=A0A366IJ09_9MICO|nr:MULTISPECIES: primosomal protein N' [Brevibacterium]RBP61593.1 replication restart DNA helicase PriA [Brevibacterium sanguinis]RBP70845.1 replication restart DNA helicase PriA [Brevibacterium celere]
MDEPLPIDTGTSALGQVPLAPDDPVAHVLVDHPVPHLARVFDYAVPRRFADTARPGVRVRVKFAGRLRDGYVLERTAHTDHVGELAPIERITSPLVVLPPTLRELCEAVATRYAGTLTDVLRLAIPPRHAGAEKAVLRAEQGTGEAPEPHATAEADEAPEPHAAAEADESTEPHAAAEAGQLRAEGGAEESAADIVDRLGAWVVATAAPGPGLPEHPSAVTDPAADSRAAPGSPASPRPLPREALTIVPGPTPGLGWIPAGLAAASRTLAAGQSVLWLVPDHRELDVLAAALRAAGIEHGVLGAEQSPAERWTNWLGGRLGRTRLLIGTRAAAFAPLEDLGLIICLNDSNENYLDQHAPYPHAREVCLLRSSLESTGLLFVSTDRSPEVQRLVEIGWLTDISPTRPDRRAGSPLVLVPDEDRDPDAWQRIPSRAWQLMRSALDPARSSRRPGTSGPSAEAPRPGPVLVQVPRSGYYPVFACARCQEVARCPQCRANLTTASEVGPFACRSCGHRSETFTCSRCRSHEVRSIVRGRGRTVEELRRALPGVEILESGGEHIATAIDDTPRIVVATTGAEPYAVGGYAAAILLDSLWPGPWMRATDESLSRRLRAASLVRSRDEGGTVHLGEADEAIRAALVAFDPIAYMSRQLADRRELGFPPYRRIVELTGAGADIDAVLSAVDGLEELIRDDADEGLRAVAAYPIAAGPRIGAELAAITASRSARKLPQVRIRIDDPRSL